MQIFEIVVNNYYNVSVLRNYSSLYIKMTDVVMGAKVNSEDQPLLSNVQDSAVLKSSDTHHKPRVHYKDFDIPDIGHNAENTDCGQRESSCYTTSDTDKPRISNERVVLKTLLGIHDAHSNINKPEKWLTPNMCSLSPRYTDILLYRVYIFTN